MRTVVIGLGNPILRDDGVGLVVARAVRTGLAGRRDVDILEDTHGGLRLMERMTGYDRAVIVDSLISGRPPGTVVEIDLRTMSTQHSSSSHDVDLPTALAVGRRAGAHLPADESIRVFAVEGRQVDIFGDDLTPAVASAVPQAVRMVLEAVQPQGAEP
ncbi:MAG TPA: hydrogenase maturation protease [Anaerolineales bacterium]|nr:hydrogenase maturation protease [Anaerolineales bacterium]